MSEKQDNLPTLASLRARRGHVRAPRRPSGSQAAPSASAAEGFHQTGLLFGLDSGPEDLLLPVAEAAAVPALEPQGVSQPESVATPPASSPRRAVSERRIWSVRALVADVRQHVETAYTDLWVEGEISNCRIAPSGHVYFTLKDGEAQLPVVLFRRQALLLRFRPADGLAVLVRGRISIYDTRGQLQLVAETMEPRGAGALQLAFEQLKARLLAEGLFDAARKRALPAFPACVGIITSPTGAVIRDIVNVIRRRHARLNLLVFPATMQGVNCAASVAAGVRWFNKNSSLADVIVIARGGGSMEDLAGFNDESLARVIAGSKIPVVSAIGHETDFTIADFVADLRAPTPSAAAELVTAAQHRIEERVQSLAMRVHRAGRFHLMHARQRYARLSAESVLTRLHDAVSRRDQRIDELRLRLESAAARRLRLPAARLGGLSERLRRQDVSLRIARAQRRLQQDVARFERAASQMLSPRWNRLNRAAARLEALSPLAVLSRGYAIVYAADGTVLRAASETAAGQMIRARLSQGSLEAQVTDTKTTETSNT
ncbi:exodeoxyribonuclease VII large subunit [Edaphobacter aggregans]|uniref:Exodeoxyribonuclease 7 large subunit n=1 Tax=Edaphobacter aggregans TaxID=570835 RepID=A0A3R9PRK7_9BACT|nr:exodeoxyribonuclease VII large subunit [Edaphobacter aggregans]RSL16299.1 exodeoxyribonuclease VII large subunit [Edaphobacter aggregans]